MMTSRTVNGWGRELETKTTSTKLGSRSPHERSKHFDSQVQSRLWYAVRARFQFQREFLPKAEFKQFGFACKRGINFKCFRVRFTSSEQTSWLRYFMLSSILENLRRNPCEFEIASESLKLLRAKIAFYEHLR